MTTKTRTVAVVYHSGYGHTARQAEAVAAGINSVPGTRTLMVPTGEVDAHWDDLAGADALVFGSPTYMGGVSAPFKAFMDASSKVWSNQGWKDKLAAGFTNSASQSGDKLNTLIQMSVFAAQHGMVWISLGLMPGNNSSAGSANDLNRLGSYLGAMAQSNADAPPAVAPPDADLRTAHALGARVAEAARRWAG
ncbi:MAG: flavodoxin family protein [Actinomycetota bacterium]